jgi:hypothetical protein
MKTYEHKPEEELLLNGVPYTGESGATNRVSHRQWKGAVAASVLGVVLLFAPAHAHAGIFDVFGEIFGTIQSDIGSSLQSINQITQQVQQLYQTTMWRLRCEFDLQLSQSDEPDLLDAMHQRGHDGSAAVRVDLA